MPGPDQTEAQGHLDANAATHAAAALQPPAKKGRLSRRLFTGLMAVEFLLAIMVRIFIGVILFVLPWSPLWDNNHLLLTFPRLAALLTHGATRGIVSGLGLLNLWIAVDDTLHRGERHS